MKTQKVVQYADEAIGLGDIILVAALVAACCYLSGCGYALVKIPEPGMRTSITTEQRIQSAFETGVESYAEGQVDPAAWIRQRRAR